MKIFYLLAFANVSTTFALTFGISSNHLNSVKYFVTTTATTITPRSSLFLSARSPSKVIEDDDVAYDLSESNWSDNDFDEDSLKEEEIVKVDDLPNRKYDESDESWRRGDMDGCDDPIQAPWRQAAEAIIYSTAEELGAVIQDITWGMAMCTITVQSTSNMEKPLDEYLQERQVREDAYPYLRESRNAEIDIEFESSEDTVVDMDGVGVLAGSIIEALQLAEDDEDSNVNDVLARHEIIVTSPGVSNILETQKQFDAFTGFDVIVHTIDPFNSGNGRKLEGKLMSRDAMDLHIGQKGRKVSIPNNFVDYVELPKAKREAGDTML